VLDLQDPGPQLGGSLLLIRLPFDSSLRSSLRDRSHPGR